MNNIYQLILLLLFFSFVSPESIRNGNGQEIFVSNNENDTEGILNMSQVFMRFD